MEINHIIIENATAYEFVDEISRWKVYEISDHYLGCLIVCLCIIVHYFTLVGGAGAPRSGIFTEQFMEENFGEEHQLAFGEKISKGGYPDCGSGRYTMKAGYEAWMKFNSAQRAHLNYAENIT